MLYEKVFEEIKRHTSFKYIALAFDRKEFAQMLYDENKRKIWRLSVVREKSAELDNVVNTVKTAVATASASK